MSSKNFRVLSENVCSAFPKFWKLKTVENIAKEAIKARVIDVKITWVSNYRFSIQTPVIGHPRYRAPIKWQIGAQRTNQDREIFL